jgi:hypothetical protein
MGGFVDLINDLSEAGLRLDSRFTLGSLKGYMTLAGEGYVTPELFKQKVSEQVRHTLIQDKPGAAVLDEAGKGLRCVQALSDALRSLERNPAKR